MSQASPVPLIYISAASLIARSGSDPPVTYLLNSFLLLYSLHSVFRERKEGVG